MIYRKTKTDRVSRLLSHVLPIRLEGISKPNLRYRLDSQTQKHVYILEVYRYRLLLCYLTHTEHIGFRHLWGIVYASRKDVLRRRQISLRVFRHVKLFVLLLVRCEKLFNDDQQHPESRSPEKKTLLAPSSCHPGALLLLSSEYFFFCYGEDDDPPKAGLLTRSTF